MRTQPILCLLTIILTVLAGASPGCGASTARITILHVNDFHGHMTPFLDKPTDPGMQVGGAAYLAGLIRAERARNPEGTLLLSAGDMFQGSPVSNLFHGEPVVEMMNRLHFDAMVPGNHEFDWGTDVLKEIAARLQTSVISSNISGDSGLLPPGMKPYVMLERAGIRLGIAGVTTPDTVYTTKADNVKGIRFEDPASALKPQIEKMKREGARIIVVLSHLGLDADKELAVKLPDIDVIVGGHSHTVVRDPLTMGKTIIVQAGYYGIYLGVLQLDIDPVSSGIVGHTTTNALQLVSPLQEVPPDPDMARLTRDYSEKIRPIFSAVVGETLVDLTRNTSAESNLGNLICDAIRESTGALIAFHNSGGIRSDIPRGKISLEQLYTLLPFDDNLMTMDLTGEEILRVLEQSGGMTEKVLQMSGVFVIFDRSRPAGSRVVKALVGQEPLEPGRVYRVAVNDFLAAGGDRFTTFTEGKNVLVGEDLREAVRRYVESRSPLSPKLEGRISFLNHKIQ